MTKKKNDEVEPKQDKTAEENTTDTNAGDDAIQGTVADADVKNNTDK